MKYRYLCYNLDKNQSNPWFTDMPDVADFLAAEVGRTAIIDLETNQVVCGPAADADKTPWRTVAIHGAANKQHPLCTPVVPKIEADLKKEPANTVCTDPWHARKTNLHPCSQCKASPTHQPECAFFCTNCCHVIVRPLHDPIGKWGVSCDRCNVRTTEMAMMDGREQDCEIGCVPNGPNVTIRSYSDHAHEPRVIAVGSMKADHVPMVIKLLEAAQIYLEPRELKTASHDEKCANCGHARFLHHSGPQGLCRTAHGRRSGSSDDNWCSCPGWHSNSDTTKHTGGGA